jgi:hypothetical protein
MPVDTWNWRELEGSLDRHGHAVTPPALTADQCDRLVALYDEAQHWRARVDMARHRFGSGEYKYFAYPLPDVVEDLRQAFYARLAPIASAWNRRLGSSQRFPGRLDEYLRLCHEAGQVRPTPLLLRYREGDYNCLHQDIYGEHAFPLQVVLALSRLGEDYRGGEFLLVENLPRSQSRGTAISLDQGQAVIWATRHRPASGSRGFYRVGVRHGVSVVRRGSRHTLGLIFHDAA